MSVTGADPGFPVGGDANPRWRGRQPPTQLDTAYKNVHVIY